MLKDHTVAAFTLVEMLVATMIFIVGFVAVYSLFLTGINYRHESDRITSTALAATSLISTWRLTMQDQWSGYAPEDFVGDGDPTNGAETASPNEDFFPYPDDHGIWYRVQTATDAANDATNDESSSIRMVLLLTETADNPATLTLTDIFQRHFVDPAVSPDYLSTTFPNTIEDSSTRTWYDALSDEKKAIYILTWRKVLSRHEAVILRR